MTRVDKKKVAITLVTFRRQIRESISDLDVFSAEKGDFRLEKLDILTDAHEDIGKMMSLLGRHGQGHDLVVLPTGISEKIRCLGYRAAQAVPEIEGFVEHHFA
jgi:hypothetical protein